MFELKPTRRRRLTSRSLSIAIITGVVLINSVAWGIPLIVGSSAKVSHNSDIRTDSITAPTAVTRSPSRERLIRLTATRFPRSIAVSGEGEQAPGPPRTKSQNLPLPTPAPPPALSAKLALPTPNPNAAASTVADITESAPPATLFPRPQSKKMLPVAAADNARPRAIRRRRTTPPPASAGTRREVVLVSPYTPGLRLRPPPNSAASQSTSTFETAREIARRAAQRFDEMRRRLDRIDERDTFGQRRTVGSPRPVAPRAPRILDNAGQSLAKSAHHFVRPRLVRRRLTTPPPQPQKFAAATAHIPATDDTTGGPAIPPPITNRDLNTASESKTKSTAQPETIRRAAPDHKKVRKSASAKARRNQTNITRRARAAQPVSKRTRIAGRKRPVKSRRIARLHKSQRRPRRGRSRKVRGFRRDFYRQLVKSNFFNPTN